MAVSNERVFLLCFFFARTVSTLPQLAGEFILAQNEYADIELATTKNGKTDNIFSRRRASRQRALNYIHKSI